MAEKAGFELDIKLDSQDQKRLNQIELSLQNINRYIGQAKKLGDQGAYLSLKKQQKDLRDEARNLNKQLKQQDLTMSDLVDRFRIGGVSVGDFKAGLNNAQKTMKVLSTATKTQITLGRALKVLFISSGVGALIVALGSLVAWLTQTQKGIDLVNKGMEIFRAGVGVVVETFTKLFQEGPKALLGIGKRLKEATIDAAALADETVRQREERRKLEVETERVRTKEKELSKIAEDTSKSYKERSKAAAEAIKLEQDLLAKRLDFANRELAAIQKEVELKGDLALAEDLDKIAEKEKEIADIKEESVERQTTLNSKLNVSNQGILKQQEDLKKAVEGSLDALNERLGALNKELAAGNLQGDSLQAKLREILKLEEMIAAINDSVFATREQLTRGATPGTFDQLGPSDTFGIGEQGNIELQSFEARSSAILDAAAKQNERLKELDERRLEAFTEAQEKQRQLVEDTYGVLGEITGKYVDGEIESFNDYAKAVGSIFLDVAAKQVDSLFPAIVAKMTSLLGLPAGPIAATFIQGVIRGLLSSAKSKVSKLKEGGQLGFVAKGARHYHGGIPIGNGQEIEGGEPVLTRRAAQLFPHEINAINMASGGRRILEGGGIIGSPGPVLASSTFGGGSGIDSQMLAETIGKAVYTAAVSGLDTYARRAEREKEFIDRNIA